MTAKDPADNSQAKTADDPVKVADYIARFLADKGARHVFMLTGGGAMHLNDAFGYEPRLQCIFQHHEQASSMAAEGYARMRNTIGVLNVTTGPGGINALNGVYGAWTDSIPLFVVSGQVRRDTIPALNPVPGLRQLGDQEVDIVSMARVVTKHAALVDDPAKIRYHLEKAYHLAVTGRQGPVWLDIPIDVQGSRVVPSQLGGFDPAELIDVFIPEKLAEICGGIVERICEAKRPVIMIGSGVRLANALEEFDQVIRKLGIPVTTAWTAIDSLASDDPLYCGRPGVVGDRAGNFTVQNSDLLIVIGSRLPIRQISYNWKSFARAAFKIFVDIDSSELQKPMPRPDMAVQCDAKAFLVELERQIDAARLDGSQHADWLSWCKARQERYPVVSARQRQPAADGRINPYHFFDVLFDHLAPDAVVACGNATASVVAFQAAKIKKGQRVFTNAGCAAMGYDLPAAIGAAVAFEGRPVICLAGDGSLQLNIQELQTLAHHRLPVKLFVLNNNGYLSIRLTQDNFFKRRVGEGSKSGVSFPDACRVAAAYGLPAFRLEYENLADLAKVLATDGPVVCEVMLDPDQGFEPKLGSRQLADGRIVSSSLEDMAPLLSPEELAENMLVPPLE